MAEHVVLVLGPSAGGIRRHVAVLRDGLRGLGWSVTTAGPAGVLDGLGGVDHVVPVGWSPAALPVARRRLRAIAAGADLVHAHGLKAGVVTAAARCRPRVLTVHNVVLDDTAGRGAPVLRRIERHLPATMDRTLPVSGEIARRLGIADAPRTTVVVPAGPVPAPARGRDEVRAELDVGDAPLVVTAARLHPQKDLTTLLVAMAHVRDRRPEVRLVIAGDGPEADALRAVATRLELGPTVRFLGGRDDVADLLAAADVVALSSAWEGSPLVVAEAMLLGRPVVATAVGAVPEAVVDHETGRLVPPGDPAALAETLLELLGNPAAAERLARAGRVLAEQRFATGVLVRRVADVYDEVLAGERA